MPMFWQGCIWRDCYMADNYFSALNAFQGLVEEILELWRWGCFVGLVAVR